MFSLICGAGRAAELVVNGDFETDVAEFVVWPGYVGGDNPGEIPEWIGTGGRGINPVDAPTNPEISAWVGAGGRGINPIITTGDAPFRDNGDNETQVAFLQGVSSIEQAISGLTVGGTYTLSWDFNSRNCCGDVPIGDLLINGNSVDISGFSEEVVPVGGFELWYSASHEFVANAANLTVAFATFAANGGDSTLILDNVQLVANGNTTNLVVNGDFEVDEFEVWPGYAAVGQAPAPFRDNGDNDTSVAFMQGAASLMQTVSGLTVGEEYVLSLDFNSRNCCGDFPIASLWIDGDPVEDFPGNDLVDAVVTPVGETNPWYRYERSFVATATSMDVQIQSSPAAGGDATLIIDNVSVSAPGIDGDFNGDGQLSAIDIDLLTEEVKAGTNLGEFDLNGDNQVNDADRSVWVEDLKNTYFGDANLDGEFNSGDFVAVFTRGEYEDATPLNSTWEDGDFNGDGDFGSSDFVAAFTGGGYENGPRAGVSAVPEPATGLLGVLGLLALALRSRKS